VKIFPHKPSQKKIEDLHQRNRARYESRLPAIQKAIGDRNEAWFFGRWQDAVGLASLEYALESSLEEVAKLLFASCDYMLEAIRFGYVTNAAYFNLCLCISNVCHHQKLQTRLEKMDRSEYTSPDLVADEVVYLSSEILANLSAGRMAEAKERLSLALARPKREGLLAEIQIEKAIVEKDASGLDIALESEVNDHIKSYSRSDVRHYPGGLIDLIALGTIKIARRYGLQSTWRSVYLPVELIRD